MKPSSTFKLNKQVKHLISTIFDPVERNEFKRMMIQAQLVSEVVVRQKERSDRPQGGSPYQLNNTGTASTPE
jgi:hypothetical protein